MYVCSLLDAQELAQTDIDIAVAIKRGEEDRQVMLEEKLELEAELSEAISTLQVRIAAT